MPAINMGCRPFPVPIRSTWAAISCCRPNPLTDSSDGGHILMKVLSTVSFRNQKGLLGAPMLACCIVIALVVASLAVDFGHAATVRTQLQNATDAAALAGAQ